MESFITALEYILGLSGDTLTWWQLALRAVLIYAAGLTLVRIGKRRFMGTYTAFDMVLGITVGALLANAAADSEVFLNAIAIVFGLAMLHWLLSFVTYRWDWIETFLIGRKEVIIENSKLRLEGMRRRRISKSDIGQALRKAGLESVDEVKSAYLERNGELSVVPFENETQNEGRKQEGRPADHDDSPGDFPDDDGRAEEASAGQPDAGGNGRAGPNRSAQIVEIDVQEGVQRVVVELR